MPEFVKTFEHKKTEKRWNGWNKAEHELHNIHVEYVDDDGKLRTEEWVLEIYPYKLSFGPLSTQSNYTFQKGWTRAGRKNSGAPYYFRKRWAYKTDPGESTPSLWDPIHERFFDYP